MSGLTRPYDFGKELIKMGQNVKVFSSSFLHYTRENLIKDKSSYLINNESEVPFLYIRTLPYDGSGFMRVCNMISFYFRLIKITKCSSFENPDIIIASSPHPLTLLAGIRIAKRYRIPYICEVRDLWPESFAAYGLIKKNSPFLRLLYLGEKWIYSKADKLIFTMEGGKDYIIEKGWNKESGGPIDINKVYHINNGVDLEAFDYNKEHYQIDDADLQDKETFKVIYAGSIRLVNNIGLLLDTAKILKERGENNIKFLIWGDGNELEALKHRVNQENLTNVVFKGRVDKKYVPYITSQGQLNIVLGKNNPLYKYGGSLNKMFDYFASGKPTLFTFKLEYSLIERYRAGIDLETDKASDIANNIQLFAKLPGNEYQEYCENARFAATDYDIKVLTERLIKILEG